MTHSRTMPGRPGALRIEVLSDFRCLCAGEEFAARALRTRRTPQLALALLVAEGGRISRRRLGEALWPGLLASGQPIDAPLGVVLSVLRHLLDARADEQGAGRRLVQTPWGVELQLGPDDSTDVAELRDHLSIVLSSTQPTRAQLLSAATWCCTNVPAWPRPRWATRLPRDGALRMLQLDHHLLSRMLVHRWRHLDGEPWVPDAILDVATTALGGNPDDDGLAADVAALHERRRGSEPPGERVFTATSGDEEPVALVETTRNGDQLSPVALAR